MEVSGRAWLVSRVVRGVAVGAVVGLLLAGCSGEDARPRMAPTPAPSPSPTVSPPPSVSPTPTQAPEVLGPEETVRAWIAARNEALQSGDTSSARQFQASDCSSCEPFLNSIEETFAAGGRFIRGGWAVDAATERNPGSPEVHVDVAITIRNGSRIPASEGEPIPFEEQREILRFVVEWQEGVAVISFIGFLS